MSSCIILFDVKFVVRWFHGLVGSADGVSAVFWLVCGAETFGGPPINNLVLICLVILVIVH